LRQRPRQDPYSASLFGQAIGIAHGAYHEWTITIGTGRERITITGGKRLEEFLATVPIETRWISGHHIVWQTGQQNGPNNLGSDNHTHCSALVAAIALYLDIYILRPPNHEQQLLANAQIDWLRATRTFPGPSAAAWGWRALGASSTEGILDSAVTRANLGKLVVAGYRQRPITDPAIRQARSGHVVIVRPQGLSFSAVDGPFVAMAGNRNWRSIHMREAFHSHPTAWPNNIHLFVHDTDLEMEVP
jgi:hypothetical protein